MATFRKRGKTWRAEVCKNGIRSSACFDTKIQAKEWASQTEAQILERKLNPYSCNKTLGDAFERYANEVSPNKNDGKLSRTVLRGQRAVRLLATQ